MPQLRCQAVLISFLLVVIIAAVSVIRLSGSRKESPETAEQPGCIALCLPS
jgi:hypothetical protein